MDKFDKLEKDIRLLQMEKNKQKLSATRLFKSEILAHCKKNKIDPTNEVVEQIGLELKKQMVKSLDLAFDDKNLMLLSVVEDFIPKMATEEDIKKSFTLERPKNIGEAMGRLKRVFGDRLYGKMASKIIKELIAYGK